MMSPKEATYLLARQDVRALLDLAECALAQGLAQHVVADCVRLLPRTALPSCLVHACSATARLCTAVLCARRAASFLHAFGMHWARARRITAHMSQATAVEAPYVRSSSATGARRVMTVSLAGWSRSSA